MVKVSVIIPVYNAQQYLKQCLDSICQQTLHEIEIICIDDGSTDDSLRILQEYTKKESRLQILTQKNQGAGAARNCGLRAAKGLYLSFLDADDFLNLICWKKHSMKSRHIKRILLFSILINTIWIQTVM